MPFMNEKNALRRSDDEDSFEDLPNEVDIPNNEKLAAVPLAGGVVDAGCRSAVGLGGSGGAGGRLAQVFRVVQVVPVLQEVLEAEAVDAQTRVSKLWPLTGVAVTGLPGDRGMHRVVLGLGLHRGAT